MTPSPTGSRPTGGEVPLPDWSAFEDEELADLDDAARAEFRERAIPSPERVTRDPQRLSDERRYDVPVTVIATEFTERDAPRAGSRKGSHPVQEFTKIRDVEYVDLPTGHWPQFTRPEELGRVILASVDGPASDRHGGRRSAVRRRRARSTGATTDAATRRPRSWASSNTSGRRWRGSAQASTRPGCRRPPPRRR